MHSQSLEKSHYIGRARLSKCFLSPFCTNQMKIWSPPPLNLTVLSDSFLRQLCNSCCTYWVSSMCQTPQRVVRTPFWHRYWHLRFIPLYRRGSKRLSIWVRLPANKGRNRGLPMPSLTAPFLLKHKLGLATLFVFLHFTVSKAWAQHPHASCCPLKHPAKACSYSGWCCVFVARKDECTDLQAHGPCSWCLFVGREDWSPYFQGGL